MLFPVQSGTIPLLTSTKVLESSFNVTIKAFWHHYGCQPQDTTVLYAEWKSWRKKTSRHKRTSTMTNNRSFSYNECEFATEHTLKYNRNQWFVLIWLYSMGTCMQNFINWKRKQWKETNKHNQNMGSFQVTILHHLYFKLYLQLELNMLIQNFIEVLIALQ